MKATTIIWLLLLVPVVHELWIHGYPTLGTVIRAASAGLLVSLLLLSPLLIQALGGWALLKLGRPGAARFPPKVGE